MVKVEQMQLMTFMEQQIEKKHWHRWKQQTFFFVLALFLAQSVIFEAAVPFFIPLWSIIRRKYPDAQVATWAGGFIGVSFLGVGQWVILFLQFIVFELFYRLRVFNIPNILSVSLAVGIVQVVWQLVVYHMHVPLIVQLSILAEVVLSFCMTLFLQHILVAPSNVLIARWTYERFGAAFVVLAAVFLGMQSFTISYVHLATVLLQLVICVSAAVGGVGLSLLVATVIGIVFSMAKLSFSGMLALYAVTGVLTGSFMRAGRFSIAIVSIVPSVLFFFYDATLPLDTVYFVSISLGATLFLFVNKNVMQRLHAQLYPKREAIIMERQQWVTTQLEQTVHHFQQFVLFLRELVDVELPRPVQSLDNFLTCSGCFRADVCWGGEEAAMQHCTDGYYRAQQMPSELFKAKSEELIRMRCVRSTKLLQELEQKIVDQHMQQQLYHGKRMIALQLRDVGHHLESLLQQMQQHDVQLERLEDELLTQLQHSFINCFQVDILNNEIGSRHIVCQLTEPTTERQLFSVSERVIIPTLYEYFEEPFYIESISLKTSPFFYAEVRFKSSVRFEMEYDVYNYAKSEKSGDAYDLFPIREGLTALLLSDGMGYGARANRESQKVIQLLRQCLSYRLDPETALHTVHYMLALKKYNEDMYATLDFLLFDLQHGQLWNWKAGGVATYIVRGQQVMKIESDVSPLGTSPTFSIKAQKMQLMAGDLVFILTDGLFVSEAEWQEQEDTFVQLLATIENHDWPMSTICYDVMEQYKQQYRLQDDFTLIGCRIRHVTPTWSTVSMEGIKV